MTVIYIYVCMYVWYSSMLYWYVCIMYRMGSWLYNVHIFYVLLCTSLCVWVTDSVMLYIVFIGLVMCNACMISNVTNNQLT